MKNAVLTFLLLCLLAAVSASVPAEEKSTVVPAKDMPPTSALVPVDICDSCEETACKYTWRYPNGKDNPMNLDKGGAEQEIMYTATRQWYRRVVYRIARCVTKTEKVPQTVMVDVTRRVAGSEDILVVEESWMVRKPVSTYVDTPASGFFIVTPFAYTESERGMKYQTKQ